MCDYNMPIIYQTCVLNSNFSTHYFIFKWVFLSAYHPQTDLESTRVMVYQKQAYNLVSIWDMS